MAKVSSTVRVGSGAAWALIGQIGSAAGSMLVGVLIARLLGPSAKGTLSIIQQFVAVLVVFLGFGIGTANVYFIASNKVTIGHAVGNSFALLGISTGLASGLIALYFTITNVHASWLLWVLATLSFGAGCSLMLFSGVLMGMQGNRRPAIANTISAFSSLTTVVVATLFGHLSVELVIGATLVGNGAGLCYLLAPLMATRDDITVSLDSFKHMFSYALKGYVSELAGYVHLRLDVLVLGAMLGTTAAGLFSVGVSFAELIWFIPGALGVAVISAASRLHHGSKRDVSAFASRISTLLVVLSALALCLIVPWLLPLLFGQTFSPSVWVFFALLPGAMADGLLRVINNYALSMGIACWSEQVIAVIVNAVIVVIAASYGGIVEVALASTISYSTVLVLVALRLRREGKLKVAEFFIPRKTDVIWALDSVVSYARNIGRRAD